jgi:hypothetical protein
MRRGAALIIYLFKDWVFSCDVHRVTYDWKFGSEKNKFFVKVSRVIADSIGLHPPYG